MRLELLGRLEASVGVDVELERGIGSRGCAADRAHRGLNVLPSNGAGDIARAEAPLGQRGWVQPHAHGVAAGAPQHYVSDSCDPSQTILHVKDGVVAVCSCRRRSLRRRHVHGDGNDRRTLDCRDPQTLHVLGSRGCA